MFSFFSKPPPFKDPVLGPFTRTGDTWFSLPIATGEVFLKVTLSGDRSGPSAKALEVARELLDGHEDHIRRALEFVRADARAIEFADWSGDIEIYGFSVQASGEWAMELSLSERPDAMITVRFEEGRPCEILFGN